MRCYSESHVTYLKLWQRRSHPNKIDVSNLFLIPPPLLFYEKQAIVGIVAPKAFDLCIDTFDEYIITNLCCSNFHFDFQVSFYSFLEKQFVPCIEVMGKLRDFSMMVERNYGSACVPGTYKSYNSSLQNLTRPVYWKLVELEEKIRDQGNSIQHTFTI